MNFNEENAGRAGYRYRTNAHSISLYRNRMISDPIVRLAVHVGTLINTSSGSYKRILNI